MGKKLHIPGNTESAEYLRASDPEAYKKGTLQNLVGLTQESLDKSLGKDTDKMLSEYFEQKKAVQSMLEEENQKIQEEEKAVKEAPKTPIEAEIQQSAPIIGVDYTSYQDKKAEYEKLSEKTYTWKQNKIFKELLETEYFDTARTGIRGAGVHGHSLRLDENGLMFDMLRRQVFNKETGNVEMVRDQIGVDLDEPVVLGEPLDEETLKSKTTIYRIDGEAYKDDTEAVEVLKNIHVSRSFGAFNPVEGWD